MKLRNHEKWTSAYMPLEPEGEQPAAIKSRWEIEVSLSINEEAKKV